MRFWRPRFSLGAFILLILLAGSGLGVWMRREPWVLERALRGAADVGLSYAEFSPDGSNIVATGRGTATLVWDARTGEELASLAAGGERATFSADGRTVVVAGYGARCFDWKTNTLRCDVEALTRPPSESSALSPNGKLLVTPLGNESAAAVWDVTTGQRKFTLAHGESVQSVWLSKDGLRAATGSNDSEARVWDMETGKLLARMIGHTGNINSAKFSSDGKLLLTRGDDNTARIWDAATGAQRALLAGHTAHVWLAIFSPDGKYVLTGASDNSARLWSAADGRLQTILDHRDDVDSAAFFPDGSRVLTCCRYGSSDVCVWSLTDFTLLYTLKHPGNVPCANISPDGSRVVTACDDGIARIWVRRRPENPLGILALPELWLTVVLAIGFVWSILRDRRPVKP